MGDELIRVLKRGTRIRCKHFGAPADSPTCAAGVKYADVTKDHEPIQYRYLGSPGTPYTSRRSLPCLPNSNLGGAVCDKCELPTAEELAAEEAEIAKRFENVCTARTAIVASLGGPWKKGTAPGRGAIDCPVCGVANALHFSRAGRNGHIHAACLTKGCVAWME